MEQVTAGDGAARIACEWRGEGEAVVFVHGALVADAFRPLLDEPALSGYRLVHYHRRGYGQSSPAPGQPIPVAVQAADCLSVMRQLGIERAHLVGHSLGGAIALALAAQEPGAVHTLALLEPALILGQSGEDYRASLAQAIARARESDRRALVDRFMEARLPGYAALLDERLPTAFEQAVIDAPVAFQADVAGLLEWTFGEAELRGMTRPVLSVLGEGSDALAPRFGEVHRLLLNWIPGAEGVTLPGAFHFMPVEQPAAVAQTLAAFLQRHPVPGREEASA